MRFMSSDADFSPNVMYACSRLKKILPLMSANANHLMTLMCPSGTVRVFAVVLQAKVL